MVYVVVVHLYTKSDLASISGLKAKLQEASWVYRKDKETLDWFVMQDEKDPRAFTIVERYVDETSQKYHLENPYYHTFDKYYSMLEKDIECYRSNELDATGQVPVEESTELWTMIRRYQA